MRRVSCVPLGYTRKLKQTLTWNTPQNHSTANLENIDLGTSDMQPRKFFFTGESGEIPIWVCILFGLFTSTSHTGVHVGRLNNSANWIKGLFLPPSGWVTRHLGGRAKIVDISAQNFKSTLPPFPGLGWKISIKRAASKSPLKWNRKNEIRWHHLNNEVFKNQWFLLCCVTVSDLQYWSQKHRRYLKVGTTHHLGKGCFTNIPSKLRNPTLHKKSSQMESIEESLDSNNCVTQHKTVRRIT